MKKKVRNIIIAVVSIIVLLSLCIIGIFVQKRKDIQLAKEEAVEKQAMDSGVSAGTYTIYIKCYKESTKNIDQIAFDKIQEIGDKIYELVYEGSVTEEIGIRRNRRTSSKSNTWG